MVNIQKVDNVIKFTFTDSDFYLYGTGSISVPVNSLSLYIDESDMITYKKANSNDIFVSVPIDQTNFSSKADAIDFYKNNMVGSTGGGGGSDPNAFVAADYDSQTERINFYNASGSVVDYIDASAFIVDGMIDDVYIDNGYLVIDFNTASGKQDIRIPLSDIFDPDNYYTKTDVDTKLNNYQTISGLSAVTLSTFVNDVDFVTTAVTDAISSALSALNAKADTISGNVDTNEEVVSRALNLLNTSKQDTLIAGDNITISGNTISATGGEIPTNISYFNNDVGYVTSATTDALSGIIEQNELIVASALVDLDERKIDASAVTDYSTEISAINASLSALNASISALSASVDTKEEVISIALNSLNTRLGGLTLVKITQTDYENLAIKDENTLYVVIPDPNP